MPQFDLTVENQTFPAFRGDMNSAWPALSSKQSGLTAPPSTIQYQDFADLTDEVLRTRNTANTSFLITDTLKLDERFEIIVGNHTHALRDMNRTIAIDASGGATVTLLTAASAGNGFRTTFKKIDGSPNFVSFVVSGGGTIDGFLTIALAITNDWIEVVSDGANWRVVNRSSYLRYHDKKEYFPVQVATGVSYTIIMAEQGNSGVNTIEWPNVPQIKNKVNIWIQWTGASSGLPIDLKIERFITASFVTVWEKLNITTENTGGSEYNEIFLPLHTGNDTNLDIFALPLEGVNISTTGTWKFFAKGAATAPKIHAFGFYWNK